MQLALCIRSCICMYLAREVVATVHKTNVGWQAGCSKDMHEKFSRLFSAVDFYVCDIATKVVFIFDLTI